VLARKYRPSNFDTLIGQDALVRTLTNAIQSGRIAQAYMLTGVRGVGKTTSARIIARALNCVGADGQGGPTVTPCGACVHCRAIAEDRHVDVIEMDAASHTGVEDIRDIIDGVRYAPVSARYKVYIVDEVHMLSTKAFNALLKTLEEPPVHVKFVFATTEIRKVPVTVLSRCQRFDLRRVDAATLVAHFERVCAAEAVTAEPEAIALIARAADGSVRDGLSLLDQAMALGGRAISAESVRDMLGLADRQRGFDLFEAVVSAVPANALAILEELYRGGVDPLQVLRDLLDLTHTLTRYKITPEAALGPDSPEAERVRGTALANRLSLPALARLWQMLLKGIGEAQGAPSPAQAVEMVIIRIAYASSLPPPADLVRRLQDGGGLTGSGTGAPGALSSVSASSSSSGGGAAPAAVSGPPSGLAAVGGGRAAFASVAASAPSPHGAAHAVASAVAAPGMAPALAPAAQRPPLQAVAVSPAPAPLPTQVAAAAGDSAESALVPVPRDFRALAQLFAERREGTLYGHLYSNVHLVRYAPGQLEMRPKERAMPQLAARVGALLEAWTGRRWIISLSNQAGEPSLSEQDAAAVARTRAMVEAHPMVKAVLTAFPGARIAAVRETAPPAPAAESAGPDANAGAGTGGTDEADGDITAGMSEDDFFLDDGVL